MKNDTAFPVADLPWHVAGFEKFYDDAIEGDDGSTFTVRRDGVPHKLRLTEMTDDERAGVILNVWRATSGGRKLNPDDEGWRDLPDVAVDREKASAARESAAVKRHVDDATIDEKAGGFRPGSRTQQRLAQPVLRASALLTADAKAVVTVDAPALQPRARAAQPWLSPAWMRVGQGAEGAIGSPPIGNTGGGFPNGVVEAVAAATNPVFKHAIHLDWLNVTFPACPAGWAEGCDPLANVTAVREMVSNALGEPPEDRLSGWHGYRCGQEWSDAGKLAWTPGRAEAWLSLNGDTLALIPAVDQLKLWKALDALGARGRRLDPAFDDFERITDLDTIERETRAKNFTGFKIFQRMRPEDIFSGEVKGDSAIFGKRGGEGSGVYLRIYDKLLEQINKGVPEDQACDSLRYEPEYTGEKAEALFKRIAACNTPEEYARALGAAIVDCVDFLDRAAVSEKSRHHLSRAERLPWWERIVKILTEGPIIRVLRRISTLGQGFAAFKKQWGGFLTLLDSCLHSLPTPMQAAALVQEIIERRGGDVGKLDKRRDLTVDLPGLLALA